jgi:YecR-like lipoprotein
MGKPECVESLIGNEKPVIDPAQGLIAARQRCAAWGYKDAEPFGGEKRQCQQFYGGDCIRWFVTLTINAWVPTSQPKRIRSLTVGQVMDYLHATIEEFAATATRTLSASARGAV